MQVFALGILVVQIAEREGTPELAPLYLGLMGLARAIPGLAFTVLAGLLFLPIGVPGLLAVNALSFGAILGALRAIPAIPPAAKPSASIIQSIAEGADYVRANRTLAWILVVVGTIFVMAGPTTAL